MHSESIKRIYSTSRNRAIGSNEKLAGPGEAAERWNLLFYFWCSCSRGISAYSVFSPECNFSSYFMQSVNCSSVQSQPLAPTRASSVGHQRWEWWRCVKMETRPWTRTDGDSRFDECKSETHRRHGMLGKLALTTAKILVLITYFQY